MLRIIKASCKNSSFRFCLHLLLLCTLACSTEGKPTTLKNCGRKDLQLGKIMGGQHVQPGDHPWMVSIHEKKRYGFRHICGGTILNKHYIVTAAHCIYYPGDPSMYEIYTGLYELSKKHRKPAKKYKISKIILHEDFNVITSENDIALLKTAKPINFAGSKGHVNGICLPRSNDDPLGYAKVTGWGDTYEGGENSDILKEVVIPIIPRDLCNNSYNELADKPNEQSKITETMICAGMANRDSCQNDSGGPLIQTSADGVSTLVGVVSFGYGCGKKYYPGVYTKVSSFKQWIEKNAIK